MTYQKNEIIDCTLSCLLCDLPKNRNNWKWNANTSWKYYIVWKVRSGEHSFLGNWLLQKDVNNQSHQVFNKANEDKLNISFEFWTFSILKWQNICWWINLAIMYYMLSKTLDFCELFGAEVTHVSVIAWYFPYEWTPFRGQWYIRQIFVFPLDLQKFPMFDFFPSLSGLSGWRGRGWCHGQEGVGVKRVDGGSECL